MSLISLKRLLKWAWDYCRYVEVEYELQERYSARVMVLTFMIGTLHIGPGYFYWSSPRSTLRDATLAERELVKQLLSRKAEKKRGKAEQTVLSLLNG